MGLITLDTLIDAADRGYASRGNNDAGVVRASRDDEGGDHGDHGDTLALFVARELGDVFDAGDSEGAKVSHAVRAIRRAITDLEGVADALEGLEAPRFYTAGQVSALLDHVAALARTAARSRRAALLTAEGDGEAAYWRGVDAGREHGLSTAEALLRGFLVTGDVEDVGQEGVER